MIAKLKNSMVKMNSGFVCLIVTILIWAFYFVALRTGAQSQLTSYDMALLRFMLPALLLLPVLVKARCKIMAVKKRYLLGIAAGAGLPFYLLSVIASSEVQAVVGSLLIPGVAPVFVTMIAVLCYSQRLHKSRIIGLSVVLAGVAVLLQSELSSNTEQLIGGPLLYLLAAACWAVYTISVKVSGLSGIEVATVLNVTAAVVLLLGLPTPIFTSNLASVPLEHIAGQLLIMGIFCGLISVITYGHAIQSLGAELSACWGAITPVLVSVLAFFLLSEQLDINTVFAMLAIFIGVVYANSNVSSSPVVNRSNVALK